MRKCLPLLSLLSGTLLLTNLTNAQQADKFAYAITDVPQQYGNWVYLRQMNMETGQFSGTLLYGAADNQVVYDAASKKQVTSFSPAIADKGFNPQPAFNSGVAALAYDKRNNRLWYTPMYIDQLRYIDLKTMKVFYVNNAFTGMVQKSSDQGNIITRMVIASDGNGYAMTNDAMHLIQFSTGKKTTITDLGEMVDDQANKGLSIHNSCSSFGGDIIADDDGNLYVFSARNHVFKINVASKVATHLGAITGLPANFTVNGAAVNADNKILVASAMEAASYYTVDLKSLAAVPFKVEGAVPHSSDLANGNLYVSGNAAKGGATEIIARNTPVEGNDKISVYPNPVNNNQFVVQFTNLEAGNYTVYVTDVMGRQVVQQAVNLGSDSQAQTIRLSPSAAKGVYLVKVTDQASKSVYSTKLIVQ